MVGVSAALALQRRGREVVLIDRRPAACETSYGNSGLIQREGIMPYAFPRDLSRMLTAAFNRSPQSHLEWRSLPSIAPFLYQYWRHGTPERIRATATAAKPLVERSVDEHASLMKAAEIAHMMRRTGYLKVYRREALLAADIAADEAARATYGVVSQTLNAQQIAALEPNLNGPLAGGILMPQPVSVADPGAVGRAYADLFVRRGGIFVTADATTLQQVADGWQVQRVEGPITAPSVVIALGPWSGQNMHRLGVRLPFGVKRGYHMHYQARGNAGLSRPIIDVENGYVLASMTRGIRLTTGAEFAAQGAPMTPVQLEQTEPLARALFPLGDRVDDAPWLGARPCLPDMLPAIGPVPGRDGLWVDFGHHHLGFTLGPVSGRLLSEMMCGEEPFTDPRPYRIDRFG